MMKKVCMYMMNHTADAYTAPVCSAASKTCADTVTMGTAMEAVSFLFVLLGCLIPLAVRIMLL